MATQEEIAQMQRLLEVNRRTLAVYLEQQAMFSKAYSPPAVINAIHETRSEIRRIKAVLRDWGVHYEDRPNDTESSEPGNVPDAASASPTLGPSSRGSVNVSGDAQVGQAIGINQGNITYNESQKQGNSNPDTRTLKVYLAHDGRSTERVSQVYKRLKDEGFSPWFDEEDLLPGQNWQQVTRKAIWKSDAMIIFLSKNSVSRAGYIHKEIKYALDRAEEQPEDAIFVIPVRLDDVEMPGILSHLHPLDFSGDQEQAMGRLIKTLQVRRESLSFTSAG